MITLSAHMDCFTSSVFSTFDWSSMCGCYDTFCGFKVYKK